MLDDRVMLGARRQAMMDGIFIPTPRTLQAHQEFQALIEHGKMTMGDKNWILMSAPSQSGKTTVIKSFVNTRNTLELMGQRKAPVLHVTLHAEATRKGLAHDILHTLQEVLQVETGAHKGTERELWERVYVYLKAASVELLILDEIHHLKSSTSDRTAYSIGECIKRSLIAGPCPIVLSGIESAELSALSNEQLANRCLSVIDLRKLSFSVQSDLTLFVDFLCDYIARAEEIGVATNIGALVDGDIPTCLIDASGGVLGEACRLIKAAVVKMTRLGRDELIREDLIEATNTALIASGRLNYNPFVTGPRLENAS